MKTCKQNRLTRIFFTVPTVLLILWAGSVWAQEHPEHPEHPTKPKARAVQVTVEEMAQAITDYVSSDTELKGGFFFIFDEKGGKTLRLTLDKVHKERVSQVGDNLFFACSDFKEAGGNMYDLDFFMESDGGKLKVTEIMIHKEEGQPRYQWYEEGGVWKRK